ALSDVEKTASWLPFFFAIRDFAVCLPYFLEGRLKSGYLFFRWEIAGPFFHSSQDLGLSFRTAVRRPNAFHQMPYRHELYHDARAFRPAHGSIQNDATIAHRSTDRVFDRIHAAPHYKCRGPCIITPDGTGAYVPLLLLFRAACPA